MNSVPLENAVPGVTGSVAGSATMPHDMSHVRDKPREYSISALVLACRTG